MSKPQTKTDEIPTSFRCCHRCGKPHLLKIIICMEGIMRPGEYEMLLCEACLIVFKHTVCHFISNRAKP